MTQEASKIVIWGASGHARIVTDIIKLRGDYQIVGYIDNIDPTRKGSLFCGSPILGGEEILAQLKPCGINHIIFGFGNCQARLSLTEVVRRCGLQLAIAIHPSSIVANDVVIGAGTVIAAASVVASGVTLGENVIINTGASVDHECVIEDGSHVAPGVRLGGEVRVGRGSWVGIGAVVKDKVRIGCETIIGAGAVVVGDIPDRAVAYGNPARVKRESSFPF